MENQSNYDNYNYEEIEVDIKELIGVILKRIWIILLVAVATALVAFLFTKFRITPQYESSTKIYLIAKNSEDSNKITTSDLQLGSQLTNDYIALVKSRPVLEEVIADLNLDVSLKQFDELIKISNPDNTRIIDITVRYSSPETAKLIADSVRDISSEHIKDIMDLEQVNVVEEGNIARDKVSPNITQNTLIGGILGAIVATLVILIVYFLDDTIKTPDDVERYLGLSVLGSIPILEGEAVPKKKGRYNLLKRNKKKSNPKSVRQRQV